MKIFLGIMVAMVILLGGGAVVFGPTIKEKLDALSTGPKGTGVRLQRVEASSLIETIKAEGNIEPHTDVDISATIVAEILALPFREGEEVKKDDVVVRLDDRDLQARLESANASLEASQASLKAAQASRDRTKSALDEQLERNKGILTNLDFARRSLGRKEELYRTGDITLAELEIEQERVKDIESQIATSNTSISAAESTLATSEADVLRAEASVKQAQADIKLVQEGLHDTIIESPIDGRVTKLNAEVGERVVTGTMNNPGTVILTIADLSRMKMIAQVDEQDIDAVRKGQTARVMIRSYGDRIFPGVVDRIALERTARGDGTGFYETEIQIRLDGDEIRSGGTANVDIEIQKHEGLVVPSQAIVDRDVDDLPASVIADNPLIDRSKRIFRVAYRVLNNKTIVTPVRVGPSDETHTLVLEGLSAEDFVIIGPYKVLDKVKHDEVVYDMIAEERKEAERKAKAEERRQNESTPPTSSDEPSDQRSGDGT